MNRTPASFRSKQRQLALLAHQVRHVLPQLLANGMLFGAVIALLGTGFSLMYSGCRFFAFSFGASCVAAAYTTHAFYPTIPLAAAVFAGVLVGAAIGMVLEAVVFLPMRRRGLGPLALMLASIGLYTLLQNTVSLTFTDTTRATRDWPVEVGYLLMNSRVTGLQLATTALSIGTIVGVCLLLKLGSWGGRLRAVAADPELARAVGIDVPRVRIAAATLGSGLAGLAGVLMSLDTGLVPTMGFQALLWAVLACVIGGINQVAGAIIGGILLGLVGQLSVWRVGTQWKDAILLGVLFIFLLSRPQGILGQPLHRSVA